MNGAREMSSRINQHRTAARTLRTVKAAFVALSLASLAACDQLLGVDNPASVTAQSLDDPTLLPALAAAAIQTAQCGVESFAITGGVLSGEYWSAAGLVDNHTWEWRSVGDIKNAPGSCTFSRTTSAMGFYTPLQQARFQLEDAFARLDKFTDADVPNRGLLMAQMRAYTGYALLLLAEGMCDMTIDRGPKMTKDQVLALADDRFTDAINRATALNNSALLNMARVGRARTRLDMKKLPEAAADAILVPSGFVYNVEFTDGGDARRENRIYNMTIRNDYESVPPAYQNLTVNGVAGNVPDPRVKVKDAGRNGNDGITRMWQQQKFIAQAGATPIPLASWNEAQLIYAEAVGGQQGFDAINKVRTANGVPVLTGPAPTGQAFTDLILEERRRQLWSEGQRYSDMLRYNLPFQSGVNRKGQVYSNLTCVPLPNVEVLNNPNFGS
jgi:hypothetical protein